MMSTRLGLFSSLAQGYRASFLSHCPAAPGRGALCIHGQAESQGRRASLLFVQVQDHFVNVNKMIDLAKGRRAAGKNLLCLVCGCYTIESLTSKESNHETRYHLQGA